MIHYIGNESSNPEWLRECIAMESEDEVTQRLPVICPEAFEVIAMTEGEVREALREFGEAA